MSLIRIDHHPSRRQLTIFGLLWTAFLGVAGWIVFSRFGSMPAAIGIWIAAVAVPLAGVALPELLRLVYLGMAYAAFPIGYVVSHAVLAAVYYLLILPTGLLMRLGGYDPMRRRLDPNINSYWLERKPVDDVNRYFRQY
jgi:hypothetical protein